ncbi:MAG: PAS domain S-box protein, partial [Myxococcaceae bacterium]|nr:PAS domain S-box protein [Myxococcaceae bacterium]
MTLGNRLASRAVQAVVVSLRDISERDHAELALRESEAHFRALVEHSAVGVWQTTADGHVMYANPAICELLEVESQEELVGRSLYDFFTPESGTTIRREEERRRRGVASTYEAVLVGRQGGRRQVLVAGAPLFDAEGRFRSVMGSVADITGRRLLEEQVQRAQRMESIGRIAGG